MKGAWRLLLTHGWWLCCLVGLGGYLWLVGGLASPPDPGEGAAAAAWYLKLAPIWLVLWLIAGASFGGAALRVRRRDRRGAAPRQAKTSAGRPPTCPKCGAAAVIRRRREGPARGRPYWACPEHGDLEDADGA